MLSEKSGTDSALKRLTDKDRKQIIRKSSIKPEKWQRA